MLQGIENVSNFARTRLTRYLQILVENADKIVLGNKGNRYDDVVKKLASYEYIRAGKHHYNFLSANLKLPELSTTKKFIDQQCKKVYEGQLLFDELQQFLHDNNLGNKISIFEDATKINECVDYDSSSNSLLGLVAPLNANNGLPSVNFFAAVNAKQIKESLENYSRSSYVQVLVAVANKTNSPSFILGHYGTDNRYSHKEVTARNQHIYSELIQRNVIVESFGSDGDSRFIASQKLSVNFGNFEFFQGIQLAGNLNSLFFGNQDALHIAKKLLNRLYDFGSTLIMGNRIATLNHLILVYKTFEKSQHNLNLSDLNPHDRMNYR